MDPTLLLSLLARLPDGSLTTALASGGRHLFGWTVDRFIAADLYDAINLGTTATGQWKNKPPKIPPYPRPSAPKVKKDPKSLTIHDFYGQFLGLGVPTTSE